MRKKTLLTLAAAGFIAMAITQQAQAGEQIRIVGSSTVFPFSSAVAEQFGKAGTFKTPIVESTGTGGGIKLFCAGGDDAPDIANASRAMQPEEKANCEKAGVKNVMEVEIGFDGIVLANAKGGPKFAITKPQLFQALARQVVKDGKLVANPYQNWKEIDPALPDEKIEVYGPPPTSGTRDAFVELVMEEACKNFPEFAAAYSDKKELKKQCGLIREDGNYIDAGENDNVIVQKLTANPKAVGIFGYSFLEENIGKVQAATVDGQEPTFDNILAHKYTVSRSLFIYVNKDRIGKTPGIKEFLTELTSEKAIGDEGYVTMKGLIPLTKEKREKVRSSLN